MVGPRVRISGFTLIELMVVILIIAVLASVAVPAYLEHVRKARRADAQQYLMSLAQMQQRYFLDNRAHTNVVANLMATPPSVSSYYTVSITVNAGPPSTFSIEAQPSGGGQDRDPCGTLTVTSTGLRTSSSGNNCW